MRSRFCCCRGCYCCRCCCYYFCSSPPPSPLSLARARRREIWLRMTTKPTWAAHTRCAPAHELQDCCRRSLNTPVHPAVQILIMLPADQFADMGSFVHTYNVFHLLAWDIHMLAWKGVIRMCIVDYMPQILKSDIYITVD